MKTTIKTSFWEEKQWQNSTHDLIMLIGVSHIAVIFAYFLKLYTIGLVVAIFSLLVIILIKISYHKWTKENENNTNRNKDR